MVYSCRAPKLRLGTVSKARDVLTGTESFSTLNPTTNTSITGEHHHYGQHHFFCF